MQHLLTLSFHVMQKQPWAHCTNTWSKGGSEVLLANSSQGCRMISTASPLTFPCLLSGNLPAVLSGGTDQSQAGSTDLS